MSTGAAVRLLLVDDSPWQREGWALLFGSQPDLQIVGQAGDGAQALAQLRKERADVVLMDIQMPRVNGLVATARILGDDQVLALGPAPRIILVTGVDLDQHVAAAAQAGAYAVLYKDAEPEALFDVIREAAHARDQLT
ncbi:MAG: response regulator transcription factor [Pseudolysinimonas sp.]|jgi:DNA-binding NarL/FixJ family response regulator|uniref:response regulator n=1 Tax=Pseudolysinimonas sp. TaxID=2680009 RepID=UPI003C7092C5